MNSAQVGENNFIMCAPRDEERYRRDKRREYSVGHFVAALNAEQHHAQEKPLGGAQQIQDRE